MYAIKRPQHHVPVAPAAPTPGELGLRSLLIPGLGQLAQGRRALGFWQLGTVLSYLTIAIATGATRAAWLVVVWNLWSAIDAFVSERRLSND